MPGKQNRDLIRYREVKRSQEKKQFIFGVLSIFLIILNGCSSRFEDDSAKKARDDMKAARYKAVEVMGQGMQEKEAGPVKNVTSGKQLFGSLCVGCHGENAKGIVGPDLTVSKFKYGKNRLDITRSISMGRPGGMPAFSGQISKEQVDSLVEYVLSLK